MIVQFRCHDRTTNGLSLAPPLCKLRHLVIGFIEASEPGISPNAVSIRASRIRDKFEARLR